MMADLFRNEITSTRQRLFVKTPESTKCQDIDWGTIIAVKNGSFLEEAGARWISAEDVGGWCQ